jgi:hypothetical protein
MKVTRNTDGTVSAKCYRCGRWGKWRPQYHRARQLIGSGVESKEAIKKLVTLPSDLTLDINEWSVQARVWVLRYITEEEQRLYNIRYSKEKDYLVLPIDKDNFSVRLFNIDNFKYISNYVNSNIYKYNYKDNKIVIVEDLLSFIKVSRYYSCLCIFGTTLTQAHINRIIEDHSDFVIFLDNDNLTVQTKQREMRNRLELFGKCRIIKHDKDPKACTELELKELIK